MENLHDGNDRIETNAPQTAAQPHHLPHSAQALLGRMDQKSNTRRSQAWLTVNLPTVTPGTPSSGLLGFCGWWHRCFASHIPGQGIPQNPLVNTKTRGQQPSKYLLQVY